MDDIHGSIYITQNFFFNLSLFIKFMRRWQEMFLTNFYENMKIVPLFHLLTPSPFPITIQIMKYFCSYLTILGKVKYKMRPKENKLLLHARYQECLDQTCKFFTYFQVISYSSIVLFGRWDLNTLGKCKHN